MVDPYFDDGTVQMYLGDSREILPALGVRADCVVTDPPYGETALSWDRWPDGWPALAATVTDSLWCFGSMRMFLDRVGEFDSWRLSQDVVWEKHNGTGFASDRFKRVHEHALHWYQGDWGSVRHQTPRIPYTGPDKSAHRHNPPPQHTGAIGAYIYKDDGMRLMRSVLRSPSVRRGLHPTEKPTGILDPLIRYACPPAGLVVDLFAGSGSTLDAARSAGRRAIGIEANEAYAEKAARRLEQQPLFTDTEVPDGAR